MYDVVRLSDGVVVREWPAMDSAASHADALNDLIQSYATTIAGLGRHYVVALNGKVIS